MSPLGIRTRLRGCRCGAGAMALLAALPAAPGPAAAQTPQEIVDRVDRLLRGASSEGDLTMRITTRQWQRSLDLRIHSLGTDYALVRGSVPGSNCEGSVIWYCRVSWTGLAIASTPNFHSCRPWWPARSARA